MFFTLLFSASLVSWENVHSHIFMVHYFALLICIKSIPLSLEAAWQTCRILRLALWALLGPVTLDLPVWQALLDNAKSLGRVL